MHSECGPPGVREAGCFSPVIDVGAEAQAGGLQRVKLSTLAARETEGKLCTLVLPKVDHISHPGL